MSEGDADTVIILSSELIAEVMEAHFNKIMFKQKVKVVDLRSTETGYMFSISFEELTVKKIVNGKRSELATQSFDTVINGTRDNKGRFTKIKGE